jgi:hypothetical protein
LDSSGLPHLLYQFYDDPTNHILTIVEARTDHLAISGSGELATINFEVGCLLMSRYVIPISLTILPDSKLLNNSVFYPGNTGYVQHYIDYTSKSDSTIVDVGFGIDEVSAEGNFQIYPSPATDVLNITSQTVLQNATLKVFDAAGSMMLQQKMNGNTATLDVHALAAGIYLLEVSSDGLVYREKVAVGR